MRVFGVALFFAIVFVPTSLFAQGTGTTATSSTASGSGGESQVENVSAAAASQGEFVGSGAPSYFVGIDQVFSTSSANSQGARTGSSVSRISTPTRARSATMASQRRAGMGIGGALSGNLNTQGIQSVMAFEGNTAVLAITRQQQAAIEANLTRIRGIQDGQISFIHSPMGTTAIITGMVESEGERRIAKQLLLFEPGINRVENLLEIQ